MPTATADRITKQELTVAQAAEQWLEADREIERLSALRKEADAVLKDYFERTGRTTYKRLLELVTTAPRTILDQDAIKAYLGPKLADFQTRSKPSKKITRLKK